MDKGLYNSEELIDSLIVDLNSLPKLLINGQFIHACDTVTKMGQKLGCLKKGIKDDIQSREDQIEDLKKLNNELAEKAFGATVGNGENNEEPGKK